MPLGYRGNPSWRDMSEYVVHFTKDSSARSAYDVMLTILHGRRLEPSGPFGLAKGWNSPTATQESVCFSEIPLDRLDRLVTSRSRYGLGFHQRTLVTAGGARVWYVDRDSPIADAAEHLVDGIAAERKWSDPLWSLTPFIDRPSDEPRYRFEWEREWRVPGGLDFAPEDVAFLFIPEELHEAARSFFESARRDNSGPAYSCPFLDPVWSEDRIQDALGALSTEPA